MARRWIAPLRDGRVHRRDALGWLRTHRRLGVAARRLQSGSPSRSARRLLDRVLAQIHQDRATPGVLGAWGRCTVVDEHAGIAVVTDAVLAEFHKQADVEFSRDLVHAGITHTYGYLFSTVPTPFGLKRDRWVNGDVAAALGVDRRLLTPFPSSGTLLGNATSLLGSIADLSVEAGPVADLRDFEIVTITERTEDGRVTVRTRLARRKQPLSVSEPTLLVYTVEEDGRERLVTGFPVGDGFARSLCEEPADTPIRLRYNARIEGSDLPPGGSRDIAGA